MAPPTKNPNKAPGNLKKIYPKKAKIHLNIIRFIIYANLKNKNGVSKPMKIVLLYYI